MRGVESERVLPVIAIGPAFRLLCRDRRHGRHAAPDDGGPGALLAIARGKQRPADARSVGGEEGAAVAHPRRSVQVYQDQAVRR